VKFGVPRGAAPKPRTWPVPVIAAAILLPLALAVR
jgi:hypothetical protein